MSDAQFPPDTGDGKDRVLRPSGLRLSEVIAAARLDVLGDGSLKDALATASPPRGEDSLEPQDASHLATLEDGASASPLASEEAYDDFQPMLDLGFPDALPQAPSLPAGPPQSDGAAVDRPMLEIPIRDFGLLTSFRLAPLPQVAPPSPHDLQHPETQQTSNSADLPVEISPIFSALDAAEKRAEDLEVVETGSGTFGSSVLVPPSARWNDELADAPLTANEHPSELTTVDAGQAMENAAARPTAPDATAPSSAELQSSGEEAHPVGPIAGALDAAARIAAEASATAEALESLKRALLHRMPNLDVATTPRAKEAATPRAKEAVTPRAKEDARGRVAPPPIPTFPAPAPLPRPAPSRPLVLAATIPLLPIPIRGGEPSHRPGIDLRGFLTGFGLSLAAGVVLYLLMNAG